MVSKDSILLIIKQSNGTTYNELFAKIAGNYSNINSARAALSRSLKELDFKEYIRKIGNNINITEKGLAHLYKDMKSKLVLRLNEAIVEKRDRDFGLIIKELSTLIERAKQDQDLMKITKDSSNFYICDIEAINNELKINIEHLGYLSRILEKHIATLKELDFKDRVFLETTIENIDRIKELLENSPANDILIEGDEAIINLLVDKLKCEKKKEHYIIEAKKLKDFIKIIKKEFCNNRQNFLSILSGNINISMDNNTILINSPYSNLKDFMANINSK